jgi:hypothetical protein
VLKTDPSVKYRETFQSSLIISMIMLRRFEVFTVVTMKNDVFWDFTPCGSCKNHTRATRHKNPEDTNFDNA